MPKAPSRPAVVMPTPEEDRLITAAAKADPDAQPLTPAQLKAMVPLRSLRGRPKSDNKKLLVSVRYSPEVHCPSICINVCILKKPRLDPDG